MFPAIARVRQHDACGRAGIARSDLPDLRSASFFPGSKRRSAPAFPASSPTAATAATTRRPEHRLKVYISGQKRRVDPSIKRDLRRRSAVEPGIGHLKSEHRMGRNHLAHAAGDANNAVLAAAGYNFRRFPGLAEAIFARLVRHARAAKRLATILKRDLIGERLPSSSRPGAFSAFFTDHEIATRQIDLHPPVRQITVRHEDMPERSRSLRHVCFWVTASRRQALTS